jgi:hypothetical protein
MWLVGVTWSREFSQSRVFSRSHAPVTNKFVTLVLRSLQLPLHPPVPPPFHSCRHARGSLSCISLIIVLLYTSIHVVIELLNGLLNYSGSYVWNICQQLYTILRPSSSPSRLCEGVSQPSRTDSGRSSVSVNHLSNTTDIPVVWYSMHPYFHSSLQTYCHIQHLLYSNSIYFMHLLLETLARAIRKIAKKLGELTQLDHLIFLNKYTKSAKLLIFHLANISTRQSNYASIKHTKK